MNVAAAEGALRPRSVAAAGVGYRFAYLAVAIAIGAYAATAAPNEATLGLDHFIGSAIVRERAVATVLGPESFGASGAPTAAAGWLGALAVASLAASAALAQALAALGALVTFRLVERRARRVAGPWFALAAALGAATCALGSFGIAGGIFTATFAMVLTEALDWPDRRAPLAAAAIAVLWCNVAAQGVLAPLIALVFVLGATLEGRPERERRRRWIACAGTVAAVLATPGTIRYPAIAWEQLRLDRGLEAIVAYHPADIAPLGYRCGFFLLLVVAFAFGLRRARAGDVLLFLGAGLLALASGAYLPVFGCLAAPLVAASLAESFPRVARGARDATHGVGAYGACAAALTALVAFAIPEHRPPAAYALAAMLARDGRSHRLYCGNVDWCGSALASDAPARSAGTRVFMDGRVGAYPPDVRDAQRNIVRVKNHWRHVLAAYAIDAMLVRKGRQLSGLLSLSREWHVAASDDEAVLYKRDGATR